MKLSMNGSGFVAPGGVWSWNPKPAAVCSRDSLVDKIRAAAGGGAPAVVNPGQFGAGSPTSAAPGLRRRSMSATLDESPAQAPRHTPADVSAGAAAAAPSFPETSAAHSEPPDQAADAARRRRVILGYVVALASVGLAI